MSDKNVLIWEKDDKFLKALKLYFRGSIYEPDSVDDARELLPRARERRPDAVIVAVESDDGGTRALLQALASDDATRGLPIVVMSTKKDESELFADGLAAVGAAAYIKKPFIKKAILSLLDEVFSGARPVPPPPRARAGADIGAAMVDIDQQLDSFFEKEAPASREDEFSITLEDESGGGAAPSAVMPLVSEPEPAAPPAKEEPSHDPAELRRLRERIREIEDELRQKSEEFKTVAREKEHIERSVGKKESELIDRNKVLEKQVEDLEEDVKKRKNLVAQMTASVQQLNEEIEEKDRKHTKEIEGWQQQLSKLQTQLDELTEKSSAQSHEIEDKADEMTRLGRRIEDLEGERNELQTNLERMTESKAEADRTIETLQGDLATTRETLARTEQELATERARIASASARFEQGITGYREALERDMAEVRDSIERGMKQAQDAIDRGLAQSRETVERSTASATQTLDEGLRALRGE